MHGCKPRPLVIRHSVFTHFRSSSCGLRKAMVALTAAKNLSYRGETLHLVQGDNQKPPFAQNFRHFPLAPSGDHSLRC